MRNKFLGTGEQGYHPVRKVQNVISGLRYAVLTDFSVAYKLYLSLIILIATFALRQKVDLLLILIATGLVLITEIVNSSIEALCDFVEECHNEKIKIIKDIAAAAVGISIVVWVVVCAVEVGEIWSQFRKQ
jgi:diacylglycerol kinase (ATP)